MSTTFIVWLLIALGFLIAEISNWSFYMLPFSLAAGLALVAQLMGAELWLQIAVFIGASIVFLLFIPRFSYLVTKNSGKQRGGVDRLNGSLGHITQEAGVNSFAHVQVLGEEWLCVSQDASDKLALQQPVEVIGVDGTKLIVRPTKTPRP